MSQKKTWKSLSREEQERLGNEWKRQVLNIAKDKRTNYYGAKF